MMKILVGLGTCGIAAGAEETFRKLSKKREEADAGFELAKTGCVGMCYREVLLDVHGPDGKVYTYGNMTPEKLDEILEKLQDGH